MDKIRLDKWLWQARFFKTRSLATRICGMRRVRINGKPTNKAHLGVHVGQVLTFRQGNRIRVVRIRELGQRRGPAKEAEKLYADISDGGTLLSLQFRI